MLPQYSRLGPTNIQKVYSFTLETVQWHWGHEILCPKNRICYKTNNRFGIWYLILYLIFKCKNNNVLPVIEKSSKTQLNHWKSLKLTKPTLVMFKEKLTILCKNCTNLSAMGSTLQLLWPKNKLTKFSLISYDVILRCHISVSLLTTTNYAEIPVGLLVLCSSPTGSKLKKMKIECFPRLETRMEILHWNCAML